MRIIIGYLLILWLQVILVDATVGSAKHSKHPKHQQHKHDKAPYQVDVCGDGHYVTRPYCNVDTDCQKAGTNLSNLAPTGIPIEDIYTEFGDGFCDWVSESTAFCDVQILQGDDIKGYCEALTSIYETKVPGLQLLNWCFAFDPTGVVNCDYYCDPKINPACHQNKTYDFPCGSLTTGNAGGSEYSCRGTQTPPGAGQ